MEKPLCLILLTGLIMTDCHKAQPKPDEPDLATTIAGKYTVYHCQTNGGKPGACTGSVLLTRIDATHLNTDFNISSGSPFSQNSEIRIVGKDTIVGNYTYYRHGELALEFGPGVLYVQLKKEQ